MLLRRGKGIPTKPLRTVADGGLPCAGLPPATALVVTAASDPAGAA